MISPRLLSSGATQQVRLLSSSMSIAGASAAASSAVASAELSSRSFSPLGAGIFTLDDDLAFLASVVYLARRLSSSLTIAWNSTADMCPSPSVSYLLITWRPGRKGGVRERGCVDHGRRAAGRRQRVAAHLAALGIVDKHVELAQAGTQLLGLHLA